MTNREIALSIVPAWKGALSGGGEVCDGELVARIEKALDEKDAMIKAYQEIAAHELGAEYADNLANEKLKEFREENLK